MFDLISDTIDFIKLTYSVLHFSELKSVTKHHPVIALSQLSISEFKSVKLIYSKQDNYVNYFISDLKSEINISYG